MSGEYEETDYMFVAYSVIEEDNIMTRSQSGGVEMIVMLIAHLDKISAKVYVDNGTGNNRKVLHLNSSACFLEIRYAVIGLHEIYGNYVSAFFRQGKKFSRGSHARM